LSQNSQSTPTMNICTYILNIRLILLIKYQTLLRNDRISLSSYTKVTNIENNLISWLTLYLIAYST